MPVARTPLILLGGASGSGKSYLADRFGRPHVVLDSFYRELGDDGPESPLPRTPYGEVDWDHPGTWNCPAAVAAVVELLATGRMTVPEYSLATSSRTGSATLRLACGPVVAEGIFVDEILAPLHAAGLEVEAIYLDTPAWLTAARRFARDVRERRKPLPFLLQRGWALFRADRGVRRRYVSAGFVPVAKRKVRRRLAALAGA